MNNFFIATVMFITALVAIIVLLPVANELMPSITSTMGNSTGLMVSAMLLVVIIAAIYTWVSQSMGQDEQFGQGDYSPENPY